MANILHFGAGSNAFTTSDLNALASAVRAAWVSRFIPVSNNGYTLTTVTTQDLTTSTSFNGSASGATAGTGGSGTAGAQVACCVSWKITRRYRGGHPRTYLIPPATVGTLLDASHFAVAYTASVQTAATGFLTDVAGFALPSSTIPWQLVCLHYFSHGGSVTQPPTFLNPPLGDPIQSAVVNNRIDTQRRRLGH